MGNGLGEPDDNCRRLWRIEGMARGGSLQGIQKVRIRWLAGPRTL